MTMVERETEVPWAVIDPAEGGLILVKFLWAPGQEPTGMSGPPENYDPGCGPEIDIQFAGPVGTDEQLLITDDHEEAIAEWIACNFEDDDPDWPEPDDDPFEDGY